VIFDTPTNYRVQRATNAESDAARRSIMFTESLRLAIHGRNGAITTELLTIGTSGLTIGRVVSTGHEIELREADNITFLLPRSGRLDIQIGAQNYAVYSGRLTAFRPTDRRTRSVADPIAQFHAATLQVPMARMGDLAGAAGTTTDRAFPTDGVSLQGEVGLYLTRSLPQLADTLFLRPALALPAKATKAIVYLIDDQLCELIERQSANATSRRILPAFHRVRQAEDLMHAQSDDPVSILEIAQALGVSLRSLQLAFNEVYDGLSPRDYLTRVRLDKARKRLLSAKGDGQVTTIALDSGFFHLSRFAQAYARAFGERPSETLARRGL
jgi:AraC-like DNA-binding protein